MIRRTSRRPTSHTALSGPAAALAALLAALLAACGGAAATPTAAPATPAPATPAPTAAPTVSPTPTSAATPVAFISTAYGYAATLPAGTEPRQATTPWDGEARIDSTGPYTDQVNLPNSVLFFVYGAPTDLDLDAYASKTQAQMAEWHECPPDPGAGPGSEPASYLASDLALDGTAGRRHQMTCLGLFVQKLMVVREGEALVVNMLAPPDLQAEADQLFLDLVAEMTWPA